MRRSFIAICSVLLVLIVLLALLVPSCVPTTGTIVVQATLCGVPWQGAVNYTLTLVGGVAPITGTVAPTTHSNMDPGSWTCAYVSGGPANSFLVNITPSATQTLEAGKRIIFTLNFELKQDAAIEFVTWTIDGKPIGKPGELVDYEATPCQIIDVHFKQWVDGCQGYNVTVNETSKLSIHYVDYQGLPYFPPVYIHVINNACAVNKTAPQAPSATKKSQVPSFDGKPLKPPYDVYELPYCKPTLLDVETVWELVKGLNYTKSINWFGIAKGPLEPPVVPHSCVLFELVFVTPGTYQFMLVASAELELVDAQDVNDNNDTAVSPALRLTVVVPP